ncbi:sensor histidine kinase [Paenibacillus sp. GCM10012306]|uniref:sensor histidine kinase n=1 Tax=Paenibacillus sp. GCM10012306 TaxID=3317342 RepID=UPI00361DA6DE
MIRNLLSLTSSLRNRIILIFFAMTIVPFILFSGYAYTKSVEGIKQANAAFSMSYLEQAEMNVKTYLNHLNDQINNLIGDRELQRLLEQPPQSVEEEQTISIELLSIVHQKGQHLDALRLRVFPLHPERYPTYMRALGEDATIRTENWFHRASSSSVPFWHLSMNKGPGRSPLLLYIKTFTSLHNRTPRGIVTVDLADIYFNRFFIPTKRLNGQKFLIINEDGQVIFDSASNEWTGEQLPSPKLLEQRKLYSEGVDTYTIHDREQLAAFVQMDTLPWTIISLTPMRELTEPVTKLNRLLLFFLIAYLICSVWVLVYITWNFSQPVLRLVRLMRRLEEGEFNMDIPHQERKDEIGWLFRGFHSIVRTIEELVQQSARSERVKKELEFQVLSHQINPHFLYNTLDSIRWKAEKHGQSDISEMVSALGNLLRLSLNQGKDITTVGREIEQVKAYVLIEQARIGMPLRVLYFFEEGLLDLQFIRLLLQPLVENAIQHSIRDNFEHGKVVLSGRIEGQDLLISIADNGKGIPQSVLDDLEQDHSELRKGKGSGVGLRNVNERLKITFGSNYQLQIESREGKGTRITIRHPILDGDFTEKTDDVED